MIIMTKSRQNAAGTVKVSFYSGEMAKQGRGFSYKCSRIAGIKICNPNFHSLSHLIIHVQVDNKIALVSLEDG